MAKTVPSAVICMLLVLAVLVQDFAECRSRGASSLEVHRQLFSEMKKLTMKNGDTKIITNGKKTEMPEDWELRRIPGGPDPLHHNGQDPKKPRTP